MNILISFSTVYLSNRPHFLWVYRHDNPRGMLGEHEKDLVNHEPKASDLQLSFSSVLPTSEVGSHAGKPIESVVYCFNEITLKHVLVVYEFTGTNNLVPRTFPLRTRLWHNKP